MKTNLDRLYKADKSLQTEGAWYLVDEGIEIQIARAHESNPEFKKAHVKHSAPHAALLEKGKASEELQGKILSDAFIDGCVKGWKGIVGEDDKPLEVSRENAKMLFDNYPDLLVECIQFAMNIKNFQKNEEKELSEVGKS